jgi:hypothetical protein
LSTSHTERRKRQSEENVVSDLAEIFRTCSDSAEKMYKFGDYFRDTFFVKSSHDSGFADDIPRIACPAGPSLLLLRKITALKYFSVYNYRYRT